MRFLIEYEVDISRHERHHALIYSLRVVAEIFLHSLRAIQGIHRHAVLHDNLVLLLYYTDNVISAVLCLFNARRDLYIPLFKIKVTHCALKALVK